MRFEKARYLAFVGALGLMGACSRSKIEPMFLGTGDLATLDHKLYQSDRSMTASALKLNLIHSHLLYQMLKKEGKDQEASHLLQSMAEKDQASAHLQILMAKEALVSTEPARAEGYAKRALELDPKNEDIRYEYATILTALDRVSEALVVFEGLLKEFPENEEYLNALIGIDLRRADYWVAMRRLDTALKNTNSPEHVHYRKGRLFREMGEKTKAQKEFEMALKINPNFFQAMTYLAIAYEEMGEESKATELFEKLAFLTNNSLYHRKLALIYVKNRNFDKAIDAYRNLLQLEPSDMSSLLQLARVWIELGDYENSEASFREMLRQDPQNGALNLMMGMVLDAQAKTKEALDYYLRIQSDSVAYYDSMLSRFKSYHRLDQKSELIAQLEQGLNFSSKLDEAEKSQEMFRVIAEYFGELGLWQRSEDVLKTALKKFPANERLLYKQGIVLEKTSRSNEAVKVMLSILSMNPNHVGALNFVGYTWADQGMQLEEAKRMILKAHSFEPNDPYITDSLGWVLYKMGQYDSAYKYLLQAFRAVPNEFVIVDHLADVLVKLGRVSEARSYYVKALSLKPDRQEQIQEVQAKIHGLESYLPLETVLGRWEPRCEERANRSCVSLRMRLESQAAERLPSSQAQ